MLVRPNSGIRLVLSCHACQDALAIIGLAPARADNTGVFRDIKKRGGRKVLELDPAGRKIVEVTCFLLGLVLHTRTRTRTSSTLSEQCGGDWLPSRLEAPTLLMIVTCCHALLQRFPASQAVAAGHLVSLVVGL